MEEKKTLQNIGVALMLLDEQGKAQVEAFAEGMAFAMRTMKMENAIRAAEEQ